MVDNSVCPNTSNSGIMLKIDRKKLSKVLELEGVEFSKYLFFVWNGYFQDAEASRNDHHDLQYNMYERLERKKLKDAVSIN